MDTITHKRGCFPVRRFKRFPSRDTLYPSTGTLLVVFFFSLMFALLPRHLFLFEVRHFLTCNLLWRARDENMIMSAFNVGEEAFVSVITLFFVLYMITVISDLVNFVPIY